MVISSQVWRRIRLRIRLRIRRTVSSPCKLHVLKVFLSNLTSIYTYIFIG